MVIGSGRVWRAQVDKVVLLISWCCMAACAEPPEETRSGRVGGRVLMAPGVGLANAQISVEQLDLFSDQPARVLRHLGDLETDEQGFFEPLATHLHGGALLFRVMGGSFVDPISGVKIQRDTSAELRALHWLELFEDRSDAISITPVHSLIEARFRHKAALSPDGPRVLREAYEHLNAHLGGIDWEHVLPADVNLPAISPTDEVRAAFILGGLAVLADNARADAEASPQAVNLATLTRALEEDLGDALLDGNDDNDLTPGSGLELSECLPRAACSVQPSPCPLGDCRPACSLYVNSLRTLLSQATAAYIGTRAFPAKWNKTTLGAEDARLLLDGLGRNNDPDLFGDACLETVDRLAPTVTWQAPAVERVFIGGDLSVSISASDDSGDAVRAYFPDLPEEDGDPTNNVARTTLRPLVDGPITITAAAVDPSGNERRIQRTFQVDKLPPVISIDSAGYVVDERAWWTAAASGALRGTVQEDHLEALTIRLGDTPLAVERSGASWTAQLPAGAVPEAGVQIIATAEDLAGNLATRAVTLRRDATPPSFSALASSVRDERGDTVGFVGVTPTHSHGGAPVELGGAGCPDVYKYAYLLDEAAPPFGGELGDRNPLRWSLQLTDDGVGLDPATTQFRVRRAGGGAVLRDWTAVAGAEVGGGARRFELPLTRNGAQGIPALGVTEGPIELELRGRDRLGHEVTGVRCWTHHPLGAPVHLGNGYTPGTVGHPAHPRALNAHGLEASRLQDLSSLLLNDGATGASTMEALISNGTAEPVYLRLSLIAPATASATRIFSIAHDAASTLDTDDDCNADPTACAAVPAPVTVTETFPAMLTPFELRLYTATAEGLPLTLVMPCTEPGCVNTATVRTYRLEPRTSAEQLPRYVASAWLTQAIALRPSNATYPASPPFAEFEQAAQRYTGKQADVDYCSRTQQRGLPRVTYCTQRTLFKRRQSLSSIRFSQLRTAIEASRSAMPQTIELPYAEPTAISNTEYLSIEP